MRVRALDTLHDWQYGKGKQSYTTDLGALKQSIDTRLNQWLGDCFFSTTEGVDWNNLLDIGTQALLDLEIKRVILQTGGVLRIDAYTSTLDAEDRSIAIEAKLTTIYGDLSITEALLNA
jgi:hypothetical protein